MKNELYSFDKVYKCECDSHYLRITQFADEPQISVSKLHSSTSNISLCQRIKLAIGYIFNPDKYDINGDLIFNTETYKQIAKDLSKLSKGVK